MARMGKIEFAKLINYIASFYAMDNYQIEHIDDLIEIELPVQHVNKASFEAVDELLKQIINPDGFIPAIKAYRALTGVGLKEAKEAVERYRISPNFKAYCPDQAKGATLGDILASATK